MPDEIYAAFGDGSANAVGSFYGLVLIPERAVSTADDEIAAIKIEFGGARASRIHCREIFHRIARSKSDWSHLGSGEIVEMCERICSVLDRRRSKCLLAYMPKDRFPARIRSPGGGGRPALVHRLDEKWLTLWGFFQLGRLLDPVALIAPARRAAEPGAGRPPFDGMLFRRRGPGPKVRILHLDRESSRVRWLSESVPWAVAARRLTIETDRGVTHLPITPESAARPMLLDVADLVTYSLARAIAGTDPVPYRRSLSGLDAKLVIGSAEDIPVA